MLESLHVGSKADFPFQHTIDDLHQSGETLFHQKRYQTYLDVGRVVTTQIVRTIKGTTIDSGDGPDGVRQAVNCQGMLSNDLGIQTGPQTVVQVSSKHCGFIG